MCGRYVQGRSIYDVMFRFHAKSGLAELVPRFNIAPSQPAPVIVVNSERLLDLYRWGLIPSWANDPSAGYKMINARAESVTDKPAFQKPFQRQRCLVPAGGFYEWKVDATKPAKAAKTPYFIRLASDEPFAFAGLWDRWKDAEGREIRSFTILTCPPNDLTATIHDRMPVILKRHDEDIWLDPTAKPEHLTSLLVPYPANEMTAYAVSPLVSSARNDSPELVVPAGPESGSLF